MNKYEILCQKYALSLKRTRESRQKIIDFVEIFLEAMNEYFGYPIAETKKEFDEDNKLQLTTRFTINEFPNDPSKGNSEVIIIHWTVEKVLDNYLVMFLPWDKEFKLFEKEFERFEQVYDFIFELIEENYRLEVTITPDGQQSIKDNLIPF